jgi:DNA primase catalytic core
MARIPDEEIDRIKREIPIATLVRGRGIELRQTGENLVGRCPFHDDKTPSLIITPAKNLWNCLGACRAGGDVIRWVERSEHVPFRRAVELLHRGYPNFPEVRTIAPRQSAEERLGSGCPVSVEMSDRELFDAVLGYYRKRLCDGLAPDGAAYLERRGIWSEEAVVRFGLGFADRTLGKLLPPHDLKAGKEIRRRLADVGIYRADSGREHFNGCVVFPIVGREGEILEIYGRKISDDVRHRVGSHLYLPGPHRGFWNAETLHEDKEVIVCEAIIDALTFWVHGYKNVVAAYGVNGFTAEMFEAMKACGTARVLIAYDRDEAGDHAAQELARQLGEAGIQCARVLFPRMMDVNDYARKVAPATHALGVVLRAAEWMSGPRERVATAPAPLVPRTVPHSVETRAMPAWLPMPPMRKEASQPMTPAPTRAEDVLSLVVTPVAAPDPESMPQDGAFASVSALPSASSSMPATGLELDVAADFTQVDIVRGDRHYRVRGLEKNLTFTQMKVVLRVAHGERMFLDQIDLVSARGRVQYVKQAAIDAGLREEVVKNDLAVVYRELEALQEQMIRRAVESIGEQPKIAEEDAFAAMTLLRDPQLVERILEDYERCGIVGERTNKLVAYIAATSRLLDAPLAIIVQSSSAAGKTKLMDAVLDFMPEEERVRYSAMTGQSLFYFDGTSLKHKILAISEEEGAERASYALKLLQSEGELTIASTGKDPQSGRMVTQEYRVEGPVMIVLTTTSADVDEELLNRCIVLSVDEDREQTRAIHRLQRAAETLEGMLAREERREVLALHRNAQRLLRPLRVVNPYANALTFLDGRTRTRRDHTKYLTLIRTIALLHQHQRPRKTYEHRGRSIEYIEVMPADIALANEVAHEVLGRSLDELPPQTRRLLDLVSDHVERECVEKEVMRSDLRFFQRDVRDWTGWTDVQVKVHLRKLVEMEYLLVHRGGRGQSFVYELLYDGKGKNGKPFLPGLIDVETLTTTQDRDRSASEWERSNGERDGSGSVQGVPGNGQEPVAENLENVSVDAALPLRAAFSRRKRTSGEPEAAASYSDADIDESREVAHA